LRSCGLSGRKAEYIIGFSQAVARNEFDPESLKTYEHEEIMEKLTQFRGLGRWTAEMTIVTSINVENMSPAGDLGARKAISHFYNQDKLMSEEETRDFVGKWGIHKGIITYYLIEGYLHGR
jgi:DNA-3-methyladenine glycosylase II